MHLDQISSRIRDASNSLIHVVRTLHSVADWSRDGEEDDDAVVDELLHTAVAVLRRHISTGDQEIRLLSDYFAAGYLELCRVSGTVAIPATPWIAVDDRIVPSFHSVFSQWYSARARDLLRRLRLKEEEVSESELWHLWQENKDGHRKWAKTIKVEWPSQVPMLGFERLQSLRVCQSVLPMGDKPPLPPPAEPTHADNFESINWFGTVYNFSPPQARCVRLLWEHWESGIGVGAAALFEASESTIGSQRVRDVFKLSNKKYHPAWTTAIVKVGNNVYALQPPPETGFTK